MSRAPLAGAALLLRPALRGERRVGVAVVLTIAAMVPITGASIAETYGTRAEREALRGGAASNDAFVLLLGPFRHPETVASTTHWRVGLFLLVALGVACALTVGRHGRREEELGRLELVRAGRVGALAPTAAAVAVAALEALAAALLIGGWLAADGAPGGAALAVAGQYLAVGLLGAALGALGGQLSQTGRGAATIAATALVGAYAVRGAADVDRDLDALRWITPIGWAQEVDPFGARSVGPLLLCLLLAGVLLALAAAVQLRRDLGAGILRPRRGPARGRLGGPLALAVHQQLPGALAWAVAAAAYGALVGVLLPSVGDLAGDSDAVRRAIAEIGGPGALEGALQSAVGGFVGLAAAAWAVAAAGRLGAEEAAGRAEQVLAAAVGRGRLLGTQAAALAGGVALVCLLPGLAMGVAHAIVAGDGGVLGDGIAATAVQVPAAAVLAGLALALHGWRPGAIGLGWAAVAAALVVGQLGELLGLPSIVRDASPFTHVPRVPVEDAALGPLVALAAVAAGLLAAALAAFRRRDVPA